ncbi:serine protease [Mesorhizobium sp. M1322]|uniref:S1 family peptidase n=1 Tax=Mesorhizobium sp. M1322 TaxID=2957081 RepID=UPI00333C09C7
MCRSPQRLRTSSFTPITERCRRDIAYFWMASDGDLQGLGTAFAIDPCGGFMTADHVIADARAHGRTLRTSDGDFRVEMPSDAGLIAVLGHGLVFGTVGLPQEAIAHVGRMWSPVLPGSDPPAALQGRSDFQPIDLALLQTRSPAPDHIRNLRMRSRPRGPRPGDMVVAVGYPQIDTFRGDREDARTTIAEGMQVAYGRVTQVHPQGRDSTTPTPVFEVEANWPSGMSGGPVFNAEGEVIGLVGRSVAPETGIGTGLAWATWLEALRDLPVWAPTLDPENREWRCGWAVLRSEPWHLAHMFGTVEAARAAATTFGAAYSVQPGSWRIGSDDFNCA